MNKLGKWYMYLMSYMGEPDFDMFTEDPSVLADELFVAEVFPPSELDPKRARVVTRETLLENLRGDAVDELQELLYDGTATREQTIALLNVNLLETGDNGTPVDAVRPALRISRMKALEPVIKFYSNTDTRDGAPLGLYMSGAKDKSAMPEKDMSEYNAMAKEAFAFIPKNKRGGPIPRANMSQVSRAEMEVFEQDYDKHALQP